ncbi:MAG: restriction endonuclease subunit S [Spirochaetaceae bacterium]|jgi:type I restriction enzyme M protein|nr:restriction endonuclease subunit S [Spirochaetaceae bacterium]
MGAGQDAKDLVKALGFSPKEKSEGVFQKKYTAHSDYTIEIDFKRQKIDYGEQLKTESGTTQNFSQAENWVVLECVNQLLERGYAPKNIVLEKTYPAGRGVTKRLDILLLDNMRSAYAMIECKTYGEEFEKELKNIQKNGGQLFSYFQQDTKAQLLVLYASGLMNGQIVRDTKMIKVTDEYRKSGSVEEAHKLFDGAFHEAGFWENPPYDFQVKQFTKNDLRELTEAEGLALFNKFATILRKHSVSDKPNAFNKIFNLFLAKLYDEQKKQNDELEFHWRDNDNPVDFQVRLFNLHKEGLRAFLEKELAGIYDKDFEGIKSDDELLERKKNVLKINKIYDIKEVFDDDTFEQNHRVLKEVVQLLQQYQIRYPRKQRHLSEFFEQLLTTGLKQEAGQYFTPPAITKFIVKSLPLPAMLEKNINQPVPSLPAALDYAAGSGHFITEILEEYQNIIENLDASEFYPKAKKEIASWRDDQYNWAARYVYGIEKDYRLVKVAKVGCYFYGDGLAQVVLGDGLDSFEKSKSYVGLLKDNIKKPQFSVLVSNPPYSVDGVKDDIEYIGAQDEFTLFKNLTENSSEVEALFVERAAQVLKEGGVVGIILPSSILSNGGIYAKAREIILQKFAVVAVTALGGNTFMATNTNTVVLFLRRRSDTEIRRIRDAAYKLAENTREDLTINGIETPVQKYLDYTGASEIDPEKFYYFVLNHNQKTVIIKIGEKDAEKRFLGYKIVKRRGSEGYHAVQRGKTIDECTRLFDDTRPDNPEKASTYIYKAFAGEYDFPIHDSLKDNVFYADLIDMLAFDRDGFDKNISLAVKKKIRYDEIWKTDKLVSLNELSEIKKGTPITKENTKEGNIPVVAGGKEPAYFHNEANRTGNIVTISASGAYAGFVNYFEIPIFASDCNTIQSKDEKNISTKLIYLFLKSIQEEIYSLQRGQAQSHIYADDLAKISVPLPPKPIQEKIIAEIEVVEKEDAEAKKEIEKGKEKIEQLFMNSYNKATATLRLSDENSFDISIGKRVIEADLSEKDEIPVYSANVFEPFGYIDKLLITDFSVPSILWGIDGDWMVNYMPANKSFYPTDHCGVLRVKTSKIVPKYLAWVLNKNGIEQQFSRTLRASIDRIKGLSVKFPPLAEQQKVVSKIEEIEAQIAKAQKITARAQERKNAILRKYEIKSWEEYR